MKGAAFISLVSIALIGLSNSASSEKPLGPHPDDDDIKDCNEFSKHARFNPYSVLDDIWVVFYYWGAVMPQKTFKFAVPSARNRQVLQKLLNNSRLSNPIDWSHPILVMTEKQSDRSHLLVQMGDRGQYLRYPIIPLKIKKPIILYPEDLIFKQIDNGKYIAFIQCRKGETFMLARPHDVPKKKVIQDVAAKLGFRGPGGRSYLYQGHSWMPIPEDDDYEPEMFYNYKYKHITPDDPRWAKRCDQNPPDDSQSLDFRSIETRQPDVELNPQGPVGRHRLDDLNRPVERHEFDESPQHDDKPQTCRRSNGPHLPEEVPFHDMIC